MVHLYLSLMPEALVLSMLSPREFGRYLAVGAERRTHGESVFLEVDFDAVKDEFNLESLQKRCRSHSDGSPRKSTYAAIYRVLERVPRSALGNLYLVTHDGTSREIHKTESIPPPVAEDRFHLYQEFCPILPKVVSRLDPVAFAQFITQPGQPISVPRLVFAELEIGPLSRDPEGVATNLPYHNLEQIRYCLRQLRDMPDKVSKIVQRELLSDVPFWMIRGGVYIADVSGVAAYPMPTEDELRESDYNWWIPARGDS